MQKLRIKNFLITREEGDEEKEYEVDVVGVFYKGERMTLESPMVPGSVEFEEAFLDGKPFDLTPKEIERAEDIMLDNLIEETPERLRRKWVI